MLNVADEKKGNFYEKSPLGTPACALTFRVLDQSPIYKRQPIRYPDITKPLSTWEDYLSEGDKRWQNHWESGRSSAH
jgi:hypothetical protein